MHLLSMLCAKDIGRSWKKQRIKNLCFLLKDLFEIQFSFNLDQHRDSFWPLTKTQEAQRNMATSLGASKFPNPQSLWPPGSFSFISGLVGI